MSTTREGGARATRFDRPGQTPPARGAIPHPGLVLAVFLVASFPALMYLGRHQWFYLDEFDFLADRQLTDVDDLLRPHNGHWSTLPIIAYRLLWSPFGLNHYEPYQALVVAAHLAVVALLWHVMRRAGVGPWLAMLVLVPLVYFGGSYKNIIWAFQIGFVGSILFGLIHLILADQDGPWGRRDRYGLAAGLASLLCSGIGVVMVAVVTLAVLLRRGWRVALAHGAPLAGVYLSWYVLVGRHHDDDVRSGVADIATFALEAAARSLEAYGQGVLVGTAIGIGLLVGLALAWRHVRLGVVGDQAAPIALAAGTVVLLAIAGWGRASLDLDLAEQSRYAHLVLAMLTPAIGVATQAYWRVSRWLAVGFVVLLWTGLPANVRQFDEPRFDIGNPALLVGISRIEASELVPGDTRPIPFHPEVTVDWLLRARDAERLPDLELTESQLARARFAVLLEPSVRDGSDACRPHDGPQEITASPDAPIGFRGEGVRVSWLDAGVEPPPTLVYAFENTLTATLRPLELRITPLGADQVLCGP